MPHIHIRDVPEETHAILSARATAADQSLQEYLRSRLIREAQQQTLDEVLERAGRRGGATLSLDDAVRKLRPERNHR